MAKSCSFTGYRPEKFNFALKFGTPEFIKLENKIYDAVSSLINGGCTDFYCGMAAGFDLLAGKAVIDLKRLGKCKNLKLIAVIPFDKQRESLGEMWKKLYDIVLSECDRKVVIREEYNIAAFNERNRYMVDNSDSVITYFDGKRGGTANTLNYAKKKNLEIINLAEYDMTELYNSYPAYQLCIDEEKIPDL